MFQDSQSSLAQLLQGGNQTISGIMDQAISLGRSMSDKASAQERDLLGMRAQETALAQRRVENTQQNREDAQRFTRNAFESDRRYATDTAQQTIQNNRQSTQDLFANNSSDRNYALNVNERADRNTQQGIQNVRQGAQDLFANNSSNRSYDLNVKERADRNAQQTIQNNRQSTQDTQAQTNFNTNVEQNKAMRRAALDAQELARTRQSAQDAQRQSNSDRAYQLSQDAAQRKNNPLPPKAGDPNTAEAKARKNYEDKVSLLVDQNRGSFPHGSSDAEDRLNAYATTKNIDPAKALYDSGFSPEDRNAILKARGDQTGIETSAILNAKSKEEYLGYLNKDTKTTLTPEQVLARGNLYDVVRNYHGSLAPAAAVTAVPTANAAPTTNAAQASFNKISGLLSPQR